MSRFLSDLTVSDALHMALVLGAIVAMTIAVVGVTWRPARPLPLGGLAFAMVAGLAAWRYVGLPRGVVIGALIMMGGAIVGRDLWELLIGVAPGAFIVVRSGSDLAGGALVASIAGIALVAALTIDFDRTFRDSAVGLPLLAVSVAGVLVTVPDTERAFALVGAAIPLAVLGWPFRIASLGVGAAAAVALVGWVAMGGAEARPGAGVGALAAMGLMIAEPLGRRVIGEGRPALATLAASTRLRSAVVIAIHGGLVFGASRIAGLQRGALPATLIAIAVLIPGVILGAARLPAVTGADNPDHEHPRSP